MQKCIACGVYPILIPTGGVVCPKCKVQAPSESAWDSVMASEKRKPTPLGQLLTQLEDPLITLNAIAAHSDDKGVCRMAAIPKPDKQAKCRCVLHRQRACEKVTERLLQLLIITGTKQ